MNIESNTVQASRLKPSLVWPVIMMIVGVLALWLPMVTSFGVVRLLGWLMVFDAGFQLVHAFRSQGTGPAAWKLLVALAYLIAGIYFLMHPFLAAAVVALALVMFFLVEGLVDVVSYFLSRGTGTPQWALVAGASYWILANGIVSIILGIMIWRHWPSGSMWVLGVLVGLGMLMTGTSRLMMAVAIRSHMKQSGRETARHLRAA